MKLAVKKFITNIGEKHNSGNRNRRFVRALIEKN